MRRLLVLLALVGTQAFAQDNFPPLPSEHEGLRALAQLSQRRYVGDLSKSIINNDMRVFAEAVIEGIKSLAERLKGEAELAEHSEGLHGDPSRIRSRVRWFA